MKILIACEVSGTVRDAFQALGHDAWSCDILPSQSPKHIQGDVLDILGDGWDLMVAHPPCTHLAVSGARWFPEKIADGRQENAIAFAQKLWDAPIDRIALENPVSILSTHIRKADQTVHPWMFGDRASKATCFWLKNLPVLVPSQIVEKGERIVYPSGKSLPAWYANGSHVGRASRRSKFFKGMAGAIAFQWGGDSQGEYVN